MEVLWLVTSHASDRVGVHVFESGDLEGVIDGSAGGDSFAPHLGGGIYR